MKQIKMSYKGFTFDVNPSSLKIGMAKNIGIKHIPFSTSKVEEINFQPIKISGNGRIVGENALEKAFELERIFKSKGSSYLFIPSSSPVKAFFSAFNISFDSKDNSVLYSFEFIEDCVGKKEEYCFGYTVAKRGESLYDIALRTGVDLDEIFANNKYADLFSVSKGDKVWLS